MSELLCILRVEMHMMQSRGDSGLTTTYAVERVIDYIPAVRPVSLFDLDPENESESGPDA